MGERKGYRRPKAWQANICFLVTLVSEEGEFVDIEVTARNLKAHQFRALDDFTINTLEPRADGSGSKDLADIRVKLGKVVVSLGNCEDLDEEFGGDIERYLAAENNENLCMYIWAMYQKAILTPHSFRAFPDRSAGTDGDDREGDAGESAAAARVSGVQGGEAAAA
jgi:hypothetical protein